MTDRVDDAFAALERVEVPVSWDDVVAREDDVDLDSPDVADLANVEVRSPRRRLVAVAAAAAALVVALAIVVVQADGEPDQTISSVPSSLPPTTNTTPTTNAATSSFRVFPVTAWTGDRYLVWSGEDGSTQIPRADGWAYDPVTGETTDIPTAPIAARTEAVGVWTGEELIVCCGAGDGDAATAAAYRPDTISWRRVADPPDDAWGTFAAAVWTGDQMIVVFGPNDPDARGLTAPLTVSYDPTTDQWQQLAEPPPTLARIPEAVWTGTDVVVWSGDGGFRYDPRLDTWFALPDLPAALAMTNGSVAWTGDEVIVYGNSARDESSVAGARWRPGDNSWRAISDPGLPPIDWYEGTSGSQALVWDDTTQRLVVWPAHGSEFAASVPLLAYDPDTDTWE
jgi:hypothetical protein